MSNTKLLMSPIQPTLVQEFLTDGRPYWSWHVPNQQGHITMMGIITIDNYPDVIGVNPYDWIYQVAITLEVYQDLPDESVYYTHDLSCAADCPFDLRGKPGWVYTAIPHDKDNDPTFYREGL